MTNPLPQIRPVLTVTITPASESDLERLQQNPLNIEALAQQFPAVRIFAGQFEGQYILGGSSESDLNDMWTHIRSQQETEWEVGEPQVTYLETIRKPAEAEGKYIRQTGGSGNYGHCKIRITPNEPGAGFAFVNETRTSEIPAEFIESIRQGIRQTLECGVLRGYPLVDVTATLYAGSAHETDSNEMAFQIAASIATKEALRKASPVVLEPIAEVLVEIPELHAGSLIGDLNRRRARMQSVDHSAGMTEIRAIMPLAATLLRRSFADSSLTVPGIENRIRFLGYEPVAGGNEPGEDGADVIAWKPVGPSPNHHSAAADLIFDQE